LKADKTILKPKLRLSSVVGYLALIFFSFIMMFPVIYMVSTSLKSDSEVLTFPPTIIAKHIMFSNFITIFSKLDFFRYFTNSLTISILVVIGTVLSSSIVAFGFARYNAPGKKALFIILLATLMIPYPSVMVPQFLLFKSLGWIDTYYPLIIPAFFGSAYMIFLLKQFFSSLTDDLFNAARIDGCSEFRTYWNIALPLCGPALATVSIFSFLWSWDDLLGPVIYLNSMDKYTLPVMLAGMRSRFRIIPWNTMMVGAIYCIIPSILLFFFCQRYFVQGIVTTGLKD
jgi:multiple sugar transport system permease protein